MKGILNRIHQHGVIYQDCTNIHFIRIQNQQREIFYTFNLVCQYLDNIHLFYLHFKTDRNIHPQTQTDTQKERKKGRKRRQYKHDTNTGNAATETCQ